MRFVLLFVLSLISGSMAGATEQKTLYWLLVEISRDLDTFSWGADLKAPRAEITRCKEAAGILGKMDGVGLLLPDQKDVQWVKEITAANNWVLQLPHLACEKEMAPNEQLREPTIEARKHIEGAIRALRETL